MSEMAPEAYVPDAAKIARDLREIEDLADDLLTAAVRSHSNDREMPGGDAMVALAHVANHEAWQYRVEAAEALGPVSIDDDETLEPPLQIISYWSERWRRENGNEYDMRKTIKTEVGYLRNSLEWGMAHEPEMPAFGRDVERARRKMEAILKAGNRDIISDEVECLMCQTQLRRRMVAGGYEDEWWCSLCRVHLTTPQFNLAASEAARRAFGL